MDTIYFLRQRLLDARQGRDRAECLRLKNAFSLLVEASYEHQNPEVTRILVDLEDSARDSVMGVDWKSTIPPEEEIRAVFSTNP